MYCGQLLQFQTCLRCYLKSLSRPYVLMSVCSVVCLWLWPCSDWPLLSDSPLTEEVTVSPWKGFLCSVRKKNTLPSHRGQIWPRYTRVDNMVGKKQLISRHWTTETAVGLVELLWMFVCNQGSSTIYLNILCFHMTQADCRGRGLGG